METFFSVNSLALVQERIASGGIRLQAIYHSGIGMTTAAELEDFLERLTFAASAPPWRKDCDDEMLRAAGLLSSGKITFVRNTDGMSAIIHLILGPGVQR